MHTMIDEAISDLIAVEKYLDWVEKYVTQDNGTQVCSLDSIARQNTTGHVSIIFRYLTVSGRLLFDVSTRADVAVRRRTTVVTTERFV